tara:strand:+ start:32 stop:349 length:318 start_codon:yes stop_codon:yes gene_type:complete
MNNLERLYIEVELGVTPFNELGNTASEQLFGDGIDCNDDELYSVIYDNHEELEQDKLEELLNDKDSSLLILPLDCVYSCSYEDYIKYKEQKDFEIKEREKRNAKR